MLKGCTKFRLFNLLVLFGAINILIFRTYFHKSWDVLWTSHVFSRYDVNDMTWRNSTSWRTSTSVVTSTQGLNTTSGSPGDDARAESEIHERELHGSGQGPEAWGKPGQGLDKTRGSPGDDTRAESVIHERELHGSGQGPEAWGKPGQGLDKTRSSPGDDTRAESVIHERELHGSGRGLEAWGKVVRPRASVTAPWSHGNNSSALCPLVPPRLVGPMATYREAPTLTEIVRLNPGLEPGGHYQPAECRARHRVAVIVPYRDREEHLRVLLHNLHPMLIRQQLDYFVLVVELAQPTKFNRGMLLNIGAVEALGLWDVQCFVFHDVDLVPEDDRNLYTCPESPRHMSAAVDKFQYKLPYNTILGGVMAITREHLYKVNGYPNAYFGWGGEDDDFSQRVKSGGLKVTRYPMDIARYRMIKHSRDKNNEANPQRFAMLKAFRLRQGRDGLNSLQYQVNKVEFRPAYTWILVSIDQNKVMTSLRGPARGFTS